MRMRIAFGSATLTLALAAPALAGWSSPGDTLYEYYGGGGGPMTILSDGNGGLLATLTLSQQAALQTRIFHVAGDGSILPAFNMGLETTHWTQDGTGGAYEALAYQNDVWLSHQLPSGALAPGYPFVFYDDASGFGSASGVGIASDDSGGVYVASHLDQARTFAWRVLDDGSNAGGWPAEGVVVHDVANETMFTDPTVSADGSGGLLIGFIAATSPSGSMSVRTYRYLRNGTRAWATLATPAHPNAANQVQYPALSLLPAGDHVFVCWAVDSASVREVRLKSLNLSNGLSAPGWATIGVPIVTGDPATLAVNMLADGSGGVYLTWRQGGITLAVRYTSGGTLAAGWPASGLALTPNDASPNFGTAVAASANGLIVFWSDENVGGSSRILARWLLPDGTPDPSLPADGIVVVPGVRAHPLGAMSDGNGGAYLGWVDVIWFASGQYNPYILTPVPYPTSVAVADPRAGGAVFRAWPNPAHQELRVNFTLTDASPARVELLDLAGRVARTLVLRSAGERSARFEHLDALPAGVYFVRLTHRGATRVTRVALVH
jgi:hypothetical protein